MEEKKNVKDEKIQASIIVILVFLLVILVIGVTYSVFSYKKEGSILNTITTATMTMNYVEGDAGITITDALPTSDEVGKKLSNGNEVFDFSVTTSITGNQSIVYEITAVKQPESTMDNSGAKLYLESGITPDNYDTVVLAPTKYTPLAEDDNIGAKAGEMILASIQSVKSETTYYRLRMWVADDYQIQTSSESFAVKVNAYGKSTPLRQNP